MDHLRDVIRRRLETLALKREALARTRRVRARELASIDADLVEIDVEEAELRDSLRTLAAFSPPAIAAPCRPVLVHER